jgi:hypothetical protein
MLQVFKAKFDNCNNLRKKLENFKSSQDIYGSRLIDRSVDI